MLFLSFCAPKSGLFNQQFISIGEPEYDHLFELLYNNLDSLEIRRPDLANLDVSLVIAGDPGKKYLFGLTEFVLDFGKDPNELFLLTEYLRLKYNSKNELYDEMLRASIRLNNKNYCAMYFLAKLRFRNGLFESSFPLVKHIYSTDKKQLVEKEYLYFTEKLGFDKQKNISLEEILTEKVYYLD